MMARLANGLRNPWLWLSLGSGVLFVLVFQGAYHKLNPDLFAHRDDGVITMSHAVNWVDYGHIAVEPSGQRSEGFSSPLQFMLYASAYAITGCDWEQYGTAQTGVCTFLLGVVFIGFFRSKPYWLALMAAFAGAWLMGSFYRFLGWHGSGMENALFHVLLLAAVQGMMRFWEDGKLRWQLVAIAFLATSVRTEAIFQIGCVLLVFSWAWRVEFRSWKGLHLLGLVLGTWAILQATRYAYFGSMVPNTGIAQGIDPAHNIAQLLRGNPIRLHDGSVNATEILDAHGAWLTGLGLLLLPFARISRQTRVLLALCVTVLLTAAIHPFIFGTTRLDHARTTTYFVPVSCLCILSILLSLQGHRFLRLLPVGIGTALVAYLLWGNWIEKPRNLCCPIHEYSDIAAMARNYQNANGLHRVTISTPDLGKLSYLKEFNIADLGWIGSPVMAHLRKDPDMLYDYLLEFVLPDVVEVHGPWCIEYGRMLNDSRFRKEYWGVCGSDAYKADHGKDFPDVQDGIYVRRALYRAAKSREGELVRALSNKLSLAPIAQELKMAVDTANPQAHQYVLRSAYRFLPEFRAQGMMDSLLLLFADTPTAAYDQAMLGSAANPHWVKEALAGMLPILQAQKYKRWRKGMGGYAFPLHTHGRWRFRLQYPRTLVVIAQSPNWGEWQGELLVHSIPRDPAFARTLNMQGTYFDRFKIDWTCAKKVRDDYYFKFQLPPFAIEKLRVGVMKEGKQGWAEDVPWPAVFR